jgi:hypothetical protein
MNQIPTAVLDELKRGNKIGAIRELRSVQSMTLAEAKDQVESWVSSDSDLQRVMFEQGATFRGPVSTLVFVLVLVAAIVGVLLATIGK